MGLKERARRYAEIHGMATIPLAGNVPQKNSSLRSWRDCSRAT